MDALPCKDAEPPKIAGNSGSAELAAYAAQIMERAENWNALPHGEVFMGI